MGNANHTDAPPDLPDAIETNDYHDAYRRNYDASYGSARQIGISGVRPQPEYDEDDARERALRERERDRVERAEEERKAVDAAPRVRVAPESAHAPSKSSSVVREIDAQRPPA